MTANPSDAPRHPGLPDLRGQVALVTGAAGVLGRGIALRFAAAGAAVVAHYRTGAEAAQELVARIEADGGSALALRADLAVEEECHRLVAEAAGWRGGLTALVNNAGVQPTQELVAMSLADWRAVTDPNVHSVFACTQAAAAVMRAAGGGSVTHIASIEADRPAPQHAHYCASKAAVVMHARAAALEYGPDGIRVNSVSPGLIGRPGLAEDWPEGCAAGKRRPPPGGWAPRRTWATPVSSSPRRWRPGSPVTTWSWTAVSRPARRGDRRGPAPPALNRYGQTRQYAWCPASCSRWLKSCHSCRSW